MKLLDYLIQKWRIYHALQYLPQNARLIDIGAHEGEVFHAMGRRLKKGFGIEPLLKSDVQGANYLIKPGYFPSVKPSNGGWNAITMLAVLEHIPAKSQPALAEACFQCLETNGVLVITVPSPFVDNILALLRALRLIDGMSLEEHYGFRPTDTLRIFAAPRFRMVHHKLFQFGLNHIFVFEKQGIDNLE